MPTDDEQNQGDSPQTMARILAILYLLGAVTGALTLVLPHPAGANEAGLWTNVALAASAALALGMGARWMRPWMLQVALVFGTLTITRAIYLSNDAGTFYSLWYVWVGLFAFFAFNRQAALAQLGGIGLAYGWVLSQVPPASSVVRWLMTVGTDNPGDRHPRPLRGRGILPGHARSPKGRGACDSRACAFDDAQ